MFQFKQKHDVRMNHRSDSAAVCQLSLKLSLQSRWSQLSWSVEEQSRHLQCDSDVFLPYHTWTWQKLDQVLSWLPVTQNRFSWSGSLLASHSDFSFIYSITYRLRPLTSLEILWFHLQSCDLTCVSPAVMPSRKRNILQRVTWKYFYTLSYKVCKTRVLIFSRCCLVSCLSFHSVLIHYSCCCCVNWIPDDVIQSPAVNKYKYKSKSSNSESTHDAG